MSKNTLIRISALMLVLQFSAGSPHAAKKSDKEIENEKQEALEKRLAEEKEIKAEFTYSFNDVSDKIVTVSCTGPFGRSSGSGFIATLDGKTYLFTNQHVIMGSDKISFKTASGRLLRPKSVELAAERDIARLLLDESNGLPITSSLKMNAPVAVFGNSEGGGVATELYGKVSGITSEKVEVSADFVSGNSGSPVLNLDEEVIGIASYVSWKTKKNKKTVTRRFCYRLTGERWGKVNWKKYNDKYGKLYCQNEQLIDSIYDAANTWYGNPFSRMSFEDHKDSGLRSWSDEHNTVVSRIERTMDKRITQHQLDNTNKQIRNDLEDSAEALSKVCRDRARQMRFLSEQKELSGFLRGAFKQLSDRMENAAQDIDKYGAELAEHNYFHFK